MDQFVITVSAYELLSVFICGALLTAFVDLIECGARALMCKIKSKKEMKNKDV